jgi:glycosyltransferase A (GT-A) superfamily protein (DUF2064 family)
MVIRFDEEESKSAAAFSGMDSPELPTKELEEAFSHPTSATLCPQHDNGYGYILLCVPHNAAHAIFSDVLWSDPLTALRQLKALTDCLVSVRLAE